MKRLFVAALYIASSLGASPVGADADAAMLAREGDMKKLIFHTAPKSTTSAPFQLADDAGTATLADYKGRFVLVNFWATWCAPCRKEMPGLSQLQADLGSRNFEVLTIATGRNSPVGIKKFFDEIGVKNLPRHQDPKQAVAAQMGIFGLPITVLLDENGKEVARLRGDADWGSDNAKKVIKLLIGDES